MNDKKKTFVIPEAELVCFSNEDVIATSSPLTEILKGGDWESGEGDDNDEDW